LTGTFNHWSRLAAVGALVAALGLSACGRKGPLDLPPTAATQGQPGQEAAAAPGGSPAPPTQPALLGTAESSDATLGRDASRPMAPPPSGKRQPFILDWLIN
jgi:predicted small lipoprotein YifL